MTDFSKFSIKDVLFHGHTSSEIEGVLNRIADSFPLSEIPAEESLVPGPFISGTEEEWVMNGFSGRAWTDFTLEDLRPHYASLWLLMPVAFRYYFPAYLVGAAVQPPYYNLMHTVSGALSPPPYGIIKPESEFISFVGAFSADQKSAILAFIVAFSNLLVDEYYWTDEQLEATLDFWTLKS